MWKKIKQQLLLLRHDLFVLYLLVREMTIKNSTREFNETVSR